MPELAHCSKCKQEKPQSQFAKGNGKWGLSSWCRECVSIRTVRLREERRKLIQSAAGIDRAKIICAQCKKSKPETFFRPRQRNQTGYCAKCLACERSAPSRRSWANLIGQRFSRLAVIDAVWAVHVHWFCRCDCGNEKVVDTSDLESGRIQSCGCLRQEHYRSILKIHKLPHGEAAFNAVFLDYKRHAERRAMVWGLTKEEARILFLGDCYYCGEPPKMSKTHRKGNGSFTYSGIDRLDNERGYVIGNVVSCCKRCNYAKKTYALEDFLSWIHSIASRHPREGAWPTKLAG